MTDHSELDDQHLVWKIDGDFGLEVARRWRLLNDEIDRLRAENERLTRIVDGLSTNPETIRSAVEAERARLIKAAIVKDFGVNPYYVGLGRNSIVNIPTEEQAINEVKRILGIGHRPRSER